MKNIFINSAYALIPYISGYLIGTVMSHFLIKDEYVFIQSIEIIGTCWSFVLLISGIKAVQEGRCDIGLSSRDLKDEEKADLVVYAGFMTILTDCICKAYPYKMVNVHPALIPSFCGKGFYGLHVHEAALEKGVNICMDNWGNPLQFHDFMLNNDYERLKILVQLLQQGYEDHIVLGHDFAGFQFGRAMGNHGYTRFPLFTLPMLRKRLENGQE